MAICSGLRDIDVPRLKSVWHQAEKLPGQRTALIGSAKKSSQQLARLMINRLLVLKSEHERNEREKMMLPEAVLFSLKTSRGAPEVTCYARVPCVRWCAANVKLILM